MRYGWLWAALACATSATAAAPSTSLSPGQPLQLTLPAGSFSNAVHIDLPAQAERLTVTLAATNGTQDVDLLVRFDSPFPDTTPGGGSPEPDWLMEHAQFMSVSAGGNESIVITRASKHPLREGRLYLSLVNYSQQPAPATVSATLGSAVEFVPFELLFDDTRSDCDVSGWNDTTPASPVRGNTGTTRGQQRRQAAQHAANLVAGELRPTAAIRMQMCWKQLEFDNCQGTLAQAGPRFVAIDNPGDFRSTRMLDARYVMQATPVAVHQAGTSRCRMVGEHCQTASADIMATFNTAVDGSSDASCRFDYGLEPSSNLANSFVSVAMHELAHGLGFIGFVRLDSESPTFGQQMAVFGARFDDGYGRHAIDHQAGVTRPLLSLDSEEMISAMTTAGRLRFAGPETSTSQRNFYVGLPAPDNAARLHAAPTVAPGSTYSHLAQSHSRNLMRASLASDVRTLGLGREVLADVGWSARTKPVPAYPSVSGGQYLDVARNGHGFEIRKIAGLSDAEDLYFVIFYTYDEDGRPEFFNAAGRIVDGVFLPSRNEHGDSLVRPLYQGPGQTVADSDPSFYGEVRIDFVQAGNHPACRDGTPGRHANDAAAILSWELGDKWRQWCVQPLVGGRDGVEVDFSNQWWDPGDGGWGLSVLSFPGAGGDGIGLQLYFPDAGGRGRWALVQTDRYVPGQPLPVLYPTAGYCRTCTMPGSQQFEQIGTMSIDLRAPGEGTSTISFDVTWPGPEGGRFVREGAQVVPVGTPNYR
jgi:hypothetical protein